MKMNQEKALIETDRKLLFEKLDTDKLDRSVLSLTESVDENNESDKSFVYMQKTMETQMKQQIEEINKKSRDIAKREREVEDQATKTKNWDGKLLELQTNLNTKAQQMANLDQNLKRSEKMVNQRKAQLYKNLDRFNQKLEDFNQKKKTFDKK